MSAEARRGRGASGFVAIEWVASIAMLLLPIVVLVSTMPEWAERKHAATVAAREAARDLVENWPNGNPAAAVLVAQDVAADHGVDAADVVVRVARVGESRGSDVEVDVEIRMPALGIGRMSVGAWHYTAHASRRVDDFRSR